MVITRGPGQHALSTAYRDHIKHETLNQCLKTMLGHRLRRWPNIGVVNKCV